MLSALTMLALGSLVTLDLFDIVAFFPWMGERTFITEFIYGGIGAIAIPLLISVPWGRLYFAALIATIAFAFLIHVTLVLVVLLALYEVLERMVKWIEKRTIRLQKSPTPTE